MTSDVDSVANNSVADGVADCGHEWLCSKHNEGSGCATPSRGDFDCQTPLATPSCETIWTANLSDATAAPHGVGVK